MFAISLVVPSALFAEVNVNVNLGVPVPPPPRVVAVAPPAVLFESPPLFLAPRELGFHVGVDVPYDIMFASNSYYLFYGKRWYRAGHYNGPWANVRYDSLPQHLRKHKMERIHYHRDNEYQAYNRERDHYRGKHFRPEKEYREHMKEERKRERHEEKEERKHGKHKGHD
jgi:hypothetical protein